MPEIMQNTAVMQRHIAIDKARLIESERKIYRQTAQFTAVKTTGLLFVFTVEGGNQHYAAFVGYCFIKSHHGTLSL